ncbi:unnamed protein product [Heterobilharzia americana]|nr:unnamed protein product [Heterobilharzia americana]
MGQKQPKLKQDAVEELLNQTSFTETEIQDWYKGFLKECPTGHLSIDDFKRVYTKFFPYGESARFAEYRFPVLIKCNNHGDLSQKLRWAFTMYDLDNDGYISKQDLIEVLSAIYSMIGSAVEFTDSEATPERRAEKIFQLMDLDGDDRLSLDEFINGVQCDKLLIQLLTLNTYPPHCYYQNQNVIIKFHYFFYLFIICKDLIVESCTDVSKFLCYISVKCLKSLRFHMFKTSSLCDQLSKYL